MIFPSVILSLSKDLPVLSQRHTNRETASIFMSLYQVGWILRQTQDDGPKNQPCPTLPLGLKKEKKKKENLNSFTFGNVLQEARLISPDI